MSIRAWWNRTLNKDDKTYIARVLRGFDKLYLNNLDYKKYLNQLELNNREQFNELFGNYENNLDILNKIDNISKENYGKDDDFGIIQTWAFYFDKINQIKIINKQNDKENKNITKFLVKINNLINDPTYKVKTLNAGVVYKNDEEQNIVVGKNIEKELYTIYEDDDEDKETLGGKTKKRKGTFGGKTKKRKGTFGGKTKKRGSRKR